MTDFLNDIGSNNTRIEYVFCGTCNGYFYTIIEAQGCDCGACNPVDGNGTPLTPVTRPVRN